MKQTIGLFYFSGTGNTQVVTELLSKAFERRGAAVTSQRIEHILQEQVRVDPQGYDMLGIGHPIHGFDAPRILYDFVDALPHGADKRTFVFKTAGDFITVNQGASHTAIKRLRCKGYDVCYDRIICMPSNWLMSYQAAFCKQLYQVAKAKAEHMAGEILAGQARKARISRPLRWLIKLTAYGEALGARLFGRLLAVTDACIDCGRCIENCPTANVHRENGQITFGYDCVWCMRCIYACPQQAIVPRFGKFCVLKDGYDIRHIINDPHPEGDFVTEETRGFYKHFLKYIRHVEI